MPTYLVAVSHELTSGANDKLMSPEVECRFKEQVAPRITNKSLILCEGFRLDGFVTRSHPKYDFTRSFFFGDSLGSARPTFGGFDPRSTTESELADAIARMYDEWRTVAMSLVLMDSDYRKVPTTLTELIALIRQGGPRVALKRTPTPSEVELARWIDQTSKAFDRGYLQALHTHGNRYDQCVFVGGATHVVSMALKNSKHEVIDLVPPDEIYMVFLACLSDRWTRLFLRPA